MARSITVALELDDRGFKRGLNSADQQVGKLSGGFGGLKTAIGAATAVASGFAVKGILDAQLQMEGFRSTLTAYLGSQQAANSEIQRLSTLSKSLSQDLPEVTEAFIILKRNGIDVANESLTAFSKIALGNNKSFTQLAEAVADGLMGEFERLKEFGVKVSKENDQFVMRFADGSTKIVDSAQEVIAAFKAQGEAGGQFYNAMAGPLTQALSNLNGVIFEASTAFSAGFAPALEEGAVGISAMIEANKEAIASFGKLIGESLTWILENMPTIVTGIKAFAAGWAAIKFVEIAQGLAAIRTAVLAMNAAMIANPIGAVAAAIGAAAVLIITYWDDIAAAWDRAALQIEKGMLNLKVFMYDVFGPAIQFVSDQFTALYANAAGVIASIKALGDGFDLDAISSAFDETKQAILDAAAAEQTMAEEVAEANARIEEINQSLATQTDNTEELAAESDALTGALSDLQNATDDATASTEESTSAKEDAVPVIEAVTEATDESCKAAKAEKKCLDDATKALEEQNKKREEAAKLLERQRERIDDVVGSYNDSVKAQEKRLENEREMLDYFGEEREVMTELNKLELEHERTEERLKRLKEQELITQEQLDEALAEANAQYEIAKTRVEDLTRANYEYSRSFEQGFKEAFNKFREDSTNSAKLASDLFNQAATDWREAWVRAAETGDLSFKDLLKNMKRRIVAFLADAAFVKLTEIIGNAFGIGTTGKTAGRGGSGGSGSSTGTSSGNIIDKAVDFVKGLFGFAEGGYVAGNRSVIVGEKGPEIFTPAGSGTIIPNFAGATGTAPTYVTYNINALDSRSFVEMLSSQPQLIYNITRSQARASGIAQNRSMV